MAGGVPNNSWLIGPDAICLINDIDLKVYEANKETVSRRTATRPRRSEEHRLKKIPCWLNLNVILIKTEKQGEENSQALSSNYAWPLIH